MKTGYMRHLVESKVTPRLVDDEDEPKRFRYPEPVLCGVCGKRVKQTKEFCGDCEPLVSIAEWSSAAQGVLDELYKRRGLTDLDDRVML